MNAAFRVGTSPTMPICDATEPVIPSRREFDRFLKMDFRFRFSLSESPGQRRPNNLLHSRGDPTPISTLRSELR